MSDLGTCQGCGARFLWARTPTGKRMPVELVRRPAGDVTGARGRTDGHVGDGAPLVTVWDLSILDFTDIACPDCVTSEDEYLHMLIEAGLVIPKDD